MTNGSAAGRSTATPPPGSPITDRGFDAASTGQENGIAGLSGSTPNETDDANSGVDAPTVGCVALFLAAQEAAEQTLAHVDDVVH
jgi:hypothetical protein